MRRREKLQRGGPDAVNVPHKASAAAMYLRRVRRGLVVRVVLRMRTQRAFYIARAAGQTFDSQEQGL